MRSHAAAGPLRIGITCYSNIGGSGVIASELGLHLARRGHEVHFITHSLPYRLRGYEGNIYFHQVDVTTYPVFDFPPYTLSLAAKMAEVARTHELDLFHVHYAIPHATCALLGRELLGRPIPVVTTLHGTDITLVGQEPSYFEITRWSISRSDHVTAVSEFLSARTKRGFGRDLEIEVIPNFVDPRRFSPRARRVNRERFAPRGETVLMHASNFRAIKNVDHVVKVFARVAREVPASLLMVGDGPERVVAERAAQKLGVSERVHFVGNQEHVEELMACSDIFLLPSDSESFGLGALEAMSVGLPVVATSVGGPREFIEDGVTGYLARPHDLARMVRVCLDMARHPVARRAMGRRARATVIRNYHVDKIVRRYERMYRRVVEEAAE
ncbi:MAG: N-acetyl-alpha-D-glucosaminyl L-malate synthase BshA [Candidatus Eisenbacteria bacterium]|nr:N-acetyl-alpha-D-glucosaminyl L-malate synthase BshA [Candidatus Eisenbacteria bacterium]